MMKRTFLFLWLLCIGAVASPIALGAPTKECSEKIAPGLVKQLTQQFPKLRIPRLADLDQQSIGFDLSDGGDGCFAVADGDFDGNGLQDSAVLLVPIKEGAPQLVVALRRSNLWKVYRLPTFCDAISFCYVKTEKAGTYERSAALDSPPSRPDERSRLTSKNAVLLAGRLESTGIVYAYLNKRWLYVWSSD